MSIEVSAADVLGSALLLPRRSRSQIGLGLSGPACEVSTQGKRSKSYAELNLVVVFEGATPVTMDKLFDA